MNFSTLTIGPIPLSRTSASRIYSKSYSKSYKVLNQQKNFTELPPDYTYISILGKRKAPDTPDLEHPHYIHN